MVENQNKNELDSWSLLYVMKSPVYKAKVSEKARKILWLFRFRKKKIGFC
jgi:hypothetical protein